MSFYLSIYLLRSFFFHDTPTTQLYTLSLHDALPISRVREEVGPLRGQPLAVGAVSGEDAADLPVFGGDERVDLPLALDDEPHRDRKSTRLNSSHSQISYAVFCLKKKKKRIKKYKTCK